ncbi:phosphopantetheine adenylyltransferase [Clostridiales bacterium PH28_bin88]|nr:phosphopantetheine adenylyltransferase [Clostridiales bacterium PH28_bin88]
MRMAVYPGTFDPVTNGHLDIVKRATKLFDRVILAVAEENYKNNLFSLEERVKLLRESTGSLPNVVVESFGGLLMDYVQARGACAIVRGLRAISDFEYEFQLSMMNKKLSEEVETVFLMTSSENLFVSSSIIKQVAALGGCIHGLVPPQVEAALHARYLRK